MTKDTIEHPDERDEQGKVHGKGCRVFIPSLDEPLSQHIHVFTNLEALQIPFFQYFTEALHHKSMINH